MRPFVFHGDSKFGFVRTSLFKTLGVVAVVLSGQAAAPAAIMFGDIFVTDPDSSGGGVWRIRSGVKTLISSNGGLGNVGSGTSFVDPQGVVIKNENTLIIADVRPAIFEVNITTGERTTISGLSGDSPLGVSYDAANGHIYFTDLSNDRIVRINADGSGGRTVISDNSGSNGTGAALSSPHDIKFDGTQLIVANSGTNEVLAIDVSTGNRTILSGGSGPQGTGTNFTNPTGVDFLRGQLLVADNTENLSPTSLYLVDPTTGDRTLITDSLSDDPQDAAFDGLGNVIVALQNEKVVQVNLTTGVETELVDFTGSNFNDNFLAVVVPEPSSMTLLFSLGSVCFAGVYRRRKQRVA